MLYQKQFQADENPIEQQISCFIYIRSGEDGGFESHCHPFLEIYCLLEGKKTVTLGSKAEDMGSGDVMFVPMLENHSMIHTEALNKVMVIQISNTLLDSNATVPIHAIVYGKLLANQMLYHTGKKGEIWDILVKIAELCNYPNSINGEEAYQDLGIDMSCPEQFWMLKGLVLQLFSMLLANGVIGIDESKKNRLSQTEIAKLQPVLSNMAMYPEHKITLEDAARTAGMSYHNLSRAFKRILGYGFVEHQNLIRTRRAQELLFTTDMSITDIAERLQFGTISHFNHTFKRYNGISPSDYRKRLLQNKTNN